MTSTLQKTDQVDPAVVVAHRLAKAMADCERLDDEVMEGP